MSALYARLLFQLIPKSEINVKLIVHVQLMLLLLLLLLLLVLVLLVVLLFRLRVYDACPSH